MSKSPFASGRRCNCMCHSLAAHGCPRCGSRACALESEEEHEIEDIAEKRKETKAACSDERHGPDLGHLRRLEVTSSHALYEVGCLGCGVTGVLVVNNDDVVWPSQIFVR